MPLAPLVIRTFNTINFPHDFEHEPVYQSNAFTIIQSRFFSLFLAKRVRSPLLLIVGTLPCLLFTVQYM